MRAHTRRQLTARVVVGEGASDEFEVKIGLRQGSVLSPLLFIAILDLISRKTVVKDAMKTCRRPVPGGEWQTGATGNHCGVERVVYQTRVETQPREDGSAAHRPPKGIVIWTSSWRGSN